MTGGCRKLHNEEVYNLDSSPNITMMIKSGYMKLAGNSLSFMEEMRNAYKISVGKTEGKA